MLLTYYSSPVCAKYSGISPVPLMFISNLKITNVRACQNISRTPNTPWSPGG